LEDFLYVVYVAPGLVQLGFESEGHGGPVSPEIAVDYLKLHRIHISYGSFLPPVDHPLFHGLQLPERRLAQHFIHITLDGAPVLDSVAALHQVRGRVHIGASPDNSAFGSRFEGTIETVRWLPILPSELQPAWGPEMFGAIVATVELVPLPLGTMEPLLAVGYRPEGGTIVVEHLTDGKVRLGWQAFGESARFGDSFGWDFKDPHKVGISLGSLYPAMGSALWRSHLDESQMLRDKQVVRCTVDGRQVLSQDLPTPDVSPLSVAFGQNSLMASGIADRLAGRIIATKRESWMSAP